MKKSISNETILDAALTVFAEKGYAGATTRHIAKTAEISEVTLFRRFESKQNLLIAVLEHKAKAFGVDEVVYSGDLEKDLTNIVAYYQRLIQEQFKVMIIMISEATRQPELMTIFQAVMGNTLQFANIIVQHQQAGRMTQEPPAKTLVALLSPLFLGQFLSNISPSPDLFTYEPNQLVNQFLAGRRANSD